MREAGTVSQTHQKPYLGKAPAPPSCYKVTCTKVFAMCILMPMWIYMNTETIFNHAACMDACDDENQANYSTSISFMDGKKLC